MRHGRFITLEGGEGAGKSTQQNRLVARLAELGHEVIATREPGGSEGGEAIRELLVNGPPDRWSAVTEVLLMNAARRDHLERRIRPALARGAYVVCDRFADSTRAYQGAGGEADMELIRAVEHFVVEGTRPDLTLILDLPVEDGLKRAAHRGGGEARFEAKGTEFHQKLRAGFLEIAAAEPERCVVVDARLPPDEVSELIWAVVLERLAP
ncbi:MAG TPA: dTMP kinase [Caulobacteraceae bacterium]